MAAAMQNSLQDWAAISSKITIKPSSFFNSYQSKHEQMQPYLDVWDPYLLEAAQKTTPYDLFNYPIL